MENLTNNQLLFLLSGALFTLEDNDYDEDNRFMQQCERTVEVIRAELKQRGIEDIEEALSNWESELNDNATAH